MKKYLFFATVALALASCSDNSFTGDAELGAANGNAPISFSFDVPTATRADGATAAEHLGYHFIVWGEKSESSGAEVTVASAKQVFPNYQVNYTSSTAYTTTSNTKDWEYVGFTHSANYVTNIQTCADPSAVTPTKVNSSDAPQTIKYWDYSATNYVFTAVSAKKTTSPAADDIESGYVKIAKTTAGTTVYDKGYTIAVTADADLSKLYVSDRLVITPTAGTDRNAKNAYGGNATLTFRNVLSQVRVGMYETISGYEISNISFKVTGDAAAKNTSDAPAFGAICPNIKASGYAGTLTVTYGNGTNYIENQPIIVPSGSNAADLILGTNINAISDASPLSTDVTHPTYDTSGGTYTSVFSQITNNTNLKLKVSYTLHNDISGETITVTDATAEIPAKYLQWKPNFKYTYLFKISENTNGSTGQSVAGLYPITFDAVEVVAEDGTAEYITTVSEPTITTFGTQTVAGKTTYITGDNEYPQGSNIYATFMEGSTVKTPELGGDGAQHVNVYLVTTTDATNFPITEASVAESLANPSSNKITCVANNTTSTGIFTAAPEVVSTVPGEDGVNITIPALKLTGVKATTATTAYAIEYEASNAWTGTYKKVYKVIRVTAP